MERHPQVTWSTCVPPIGIYLATWIIWNDSQGIVIGNGYSRLWLTPIASWMINKSLDYVQVHQFHTTTHTPTTVTGSNIFYVISHHIMTCLGAWLLVLVKKCSSDQTVTPLIREVSDWRLRRQIHYTGSRLTITQLVCDKWRLYPMDWLLQRIGFYFHIGCGPRNWIPYILDMSIEIGFLKKRTLEKWP